MTHSPPSHRPLYTSEERWRRDHTAWTTVQAVLAPLQFLVFLVSLVLVVQWLSMVRTTLAQHKLLQ